LYILFASLLARACGLTIGGISLISSNVTVIFLRGLFQYGLLQFGHLLGLWTRGVHSCSHRWHLSFGSSGMDSTGSSFHVIFGLFGFCVMFSLFFVLP
jgi:hypothetical protein